MSVVHLIDRAPGFSTTDGEAGLYEWAKNWIEAVESGDYGHFRSVVLVFESDDGDVATAAQSIRQMDGARLFGLLQLAAHRKMDGKGNIEDFAE